MEDIYTRSLPILGEEGTEKLRNASVAVIGLGGVGSYCVEALARSGVGSLRLIDFDTVSPSNLNRQLCALVSTVGRLKTDVIAERIADINPLCTVTCVNEFVTADNVAQLGLEDQDYVIDAIDNITAKAALAEYCEKMSIPEISVLGTGNKLRPEMLTVTDIYSTKVCPLARALRKPLRDRGVRSLRVIYSEEEPVVRDRVPASMSFVPGCAGLIAAREAVLSVAGPFAPSDGEDVQ